MENNKYFETNSTMECYKPIEFVYYQLLKCHEDPYNWKWAIIGIHNALQNCMVYALCDGSGTNILKEKIRDKYYNWIIDHNNEQVKEELNFFLELYKDIKEDHKITEIKKYFPEENDDSCVKNLNNYRNDFIHYIPSAGFYCYQYEFLEMFFVAIKIINYLIKTPNNIIFLEKSEKIYTIELLDKIQKLLEAYKQEFKPE
jgi:hypothetical protein